ncbi:MAG: ABC transporter ATP-binding protein [bacterium]
MDYILQVKKVSKKYKDKGTEVTALSNISFDLKKGDDLAIIGPSGSGKTTLLQIMSGLSQPTSGEVLIKGEQVHKGGDNKISEFRNKTIGFVFQNIYLQDYFTAKENVMLPMLINNVPRKEAKKRAEELLELVGLKDRMNHKPNKLSGGEEQRVGIARALANNPEILMADEPTAKLDKDNRDKVLEILQDINKKGISIIVITHDDAFSKIFKNVMRLELGKIKNINF